MSDDSIPLLARVLVAAEDVVSESCIRYAPHWQDSTDHKMGILAKALDALKADTGSELVANLQTAAEFFDGLGEGMSVTANDQDKQSLANILEFAYKAQAAKIAASIREVQLIAANLP